MSIKDLFDKGHSLKFIKNKTRNDLAEDVESHKYIDTYSEKRDRFFPDVDFATASNFARFGLAEEYYDSTIKRIYQTYPYDGSQTEKIQWENESTYLDIFVFENEYPRTNGYVILNETSSFTGAQDTTYNVYSASLGQYVYFKGGPHADPGGDYKNEFSAGNSKKGISKANIYHTASQRTNNLEFDLEKGVTVEFWLKKDGWVSTTSGSQREYLFHLWNSKSLAGAAATNGSMRLYSSGAPGVSSSIYLSIISGSTEIVADLNTGLTNIADGNWHHYAITTKTYDEETVNNLYVDGIHADKSIDTDSINAVDGTIIAALGGLVGPLTGSTSIGKGWGNIVSASFDEFRYWKTERNAQKIGRFWRDQVGGGTNTDNDKYDDTFNKIDLGVYFKFNEGIVGDTGIDSTVLDYSGRISNGDFINYNSTSRATGSAIVISKAAVKEFKDPIVYSTHPDVKALADSKAVSGSHHDHENLISIYKSLPGWILEDDEENSNNLKYLSQIIASYFDDLYLQIEKLPRLKDINYPDDTLYEKPLPFADRLLDARGYNPPELFSDISALGKYLNRDEKILFEKKLYEVKDIIYQNIYNNLSYIQKSKGTYKSLRNFLRCFGVDEELIKLNIYSNNGEYEFKNNESHKSIQKKYIDFDDLETRFTASGVYNDAYTATAYQYYDATDSNSLSYIPAATESLLTGAMITIETEVVFPKRRPVLDINYQSFPSLTSSIFGLHAVQASNTQLTYDPSDTVNFSIVATKPDNDLRNVKFALITSGTSVFTEVKNSSSYASVYDNEKWNLAFRLRPTKAKTDTTNMLNTSVGYLEPAASAYTYELYGVNYLSNVLQNEFILSGTISSAEALTFFTKPKRIFIGADRSNFTGSVQNFSDVKISSTRVWLDYLSDETIRAHARDASSHGSLQPFRNTNDTLNTNYVPQISTLVLNWAMDNLTGSDASGQFLIDDFTSGSTDNRLKSGDHWASPLSKYNYSGRGDKFMTNVDYSDQSIDLNFIQSAKLKLPEVVNSDDMVKILNKQDDVVFTRDTTYVQHLLSVEKSMYQTVSEEMLKMFATVTDFNNIVGEPVNKYRQNYKKLEKLRQIFFENVENDRMDLEKFIEYFKWVDDAVTVMISQLIPVSSNSVDLLRNMVESHIFERNKYFHKFPTFELKPHEPVSPIKSIEELKYNWKFGHAPVGAAENSNQDESCLWWEQRAERDGVLSSSVGGVNDNKNIILKSAVTEVSGFGATFKTPSGTKYAQTYYYNRSLARPVDLQTKTSLKLKGGSNPSNTNLHDYYKNVIKWGSDDDFIYLDVDNEIKEKVCNDEEVPAALDKKKFRMKALVMSAEETKDSNAAGTGLNDQQYSDAKSTLLLPFSIYSSSISTGYQSIWSHHSDEFKIGISNLHDDKYGRNSEVPLQGPFTEKHVGGLQHRHTKLNQGSDNRLSRPEGWHLEHFLYQDPIEYVVNEEFTNATTTATTGTIFLGPAVNSQDGDPSPYEYWGNQANADNPWTFLSGPTPSAGTGPSSGKFAYCEVLPSKVGQTFGLRTPLIDMLDNDSTIRLFFKYHMHGSGIGTLTVQASTDREFLTGVEDILSISGQTHTSPGQAFFNAIVDSNGTCTVGPGSGSGTLVNFMNKRFYIRFLYTAGVTHLGDCAIDNVQVYKSDASGASGWNQNSFKLMHPTYDDHRRPFATHTRGTTAKRPVNIRNIEMTGSSPTTAGNFLERYEYVSTTSPEANDPYFVKHVDQITRTTAETLVTSSAISTRLAGAVTGSRVGLNYTLPDRTYLTGTTRNRTRFKSRFSSPGGYEVMSRGFLDPAHEVYSVYNATTYRNLRSRQVNNSQLQAHQGRFGTSAHTSSNSRVYGDEAVGSVNKINYLMNGDASPHKYHRNNIERPGATAFVGDADVYTEFKLGEAGGIPLVANEYFGNFNGAQYYYQTGSSNLELDTFTMTAWIRFDSEMSGATGLGALQRGKVNGIVQLGSQGGCGVSSTGSYQPQGGYRAMVVSGSPGDSTRKLGFITKYGLVVANTVPNVVIDGETVPAPDYGRPGVYYSTENLSANRWYHVAVSMAATSGSSAAAATTPSFFINGSLTETSTSYAPLGQYIATADFAGSALNNFHYIGRSKWAPQDLAMIENPSGQCDASPNQDVQNRNWEGDIDEVMIWNKRLSSEEVSLMAAVTEGSTIADVTQHSASSNLVAWYRFGDGYAAQSGGELGNTANGTHSKFRSIGGPGANAVQPTTVTGSGAEASAGASAAGSAGQPASNYEIPAGNSTFDNAFISHMIPRTENQTRWITASLI